jgi:hypothetical protein
VLPPLIGSPRAEREREIAPNLHDTDVLDGVVAVAGIGNPDSSTVRVNFFGAVAWLEDVLPLLNAR